MATPENGSYSKQHAIDRASRLFDKSVEIIKPGIRRIVEATRVEQDPAFIDVFLEGIRHGALPIFVSNHQGHVDGITVGRLVNRFRLLANDSGAPAPFPQITMPIAASLIEGNQGFLLQKAYSNFEHLLVENNIRALPVVRQRDIELGMQQRKGKDVRNLKLAIEENNMILLFAEGRVQGGRSNSEGKLNGMIPFDEDSIHLLIRIAKKNGRDPLLIPVSTFGGFQVLSPDYNFLTPQAIAAMGRIETPSLVYVHFGKPFTDTEMNNKILASGKEVTPLTQNEFVGHAVAKHLPRQSRGVYA